MVSFTSFIIHYLAISWYITSLSYWQHFKCKNNYFRDIIRANFQFLFLFMSFNIYGNVAIYTLLLHYRLFRWVLIILLLQFIRSEEIAAYMLLLYNMKYGHAAIYTLLLLYDIKWGYAAVYLSLLHYIKCRPPVHVIATHIKRRQVVVYMLALYYINCVAIYTLLHCMSRGILLFICYCYATYSVNMLPFICYCYSVEKLQYILQDAGIKLTPAPVWMVYKCFYAPWIIKDASVDSMYYLVCIQLTSTQISKT
jgi:hypothetical protein